MIRPVFTTATGKKRNKAAKIQRLVTETCLQRKKLLYRSRDQRRVPRLRTRQQLTKSYLPSSDQCEKAIIRCSGCQGCRKGTSSSQRRSIISQKTQRNQQLPSPLRLLLKMVIGSRPHQALSSSNQASPAQAPEQVPAQAPKQVPAQKAAAQTKPAAKK